jgi:hypothetical protein
LDASGKHLDEACEITYDWVVTENGKWEGGGRERERRGREGEERRGTGTGKGEGGNYY